MGWIKSKRFPGVYLYKLADGDISYSIYYRDENGKNRRIVIGRKSRGITEPYCYQKRNEILNKMRLGEDIPIKHKKRKKLLFKDVWQQYLEWAKENKSSWDREQRIFTANLIALHNLDLKEITPQVIEKLKQDQLKEYSPRTVEYALAVARQVINYAIRNELIKDYSNPISSGRVKMPKVDNAKLGYLSKEQAKELLQAIKEKGSQTLYDLTVLLLFTGARFNEVASLTWKDINFREGLIYFHSSKNGNPRHIAMADEVRRVLERRDKSTLYVIPDAKGNKMQRMPRQWQDIVDNLWPENKTAGKYRITVHTLRHTHASWMALAGADILAIKEQLGHKKIEMTLRYAHLIPSKRHEITRKIFQWL